MNKNIFIAAIFIAFLAMNATYVSSAVATPSSTESSSTPSRAPSTLTIAPSLNYEVNGSFLAWLDLSGSKALLNITKPQKLFLNVSIPKFYVAIKLSLTAKNIKVNASTGELTADVTLDAELTGNVAIYIEVNSSKETIKGIAYKSHSEKWNAKLFLPWGTVKNFSIPFPLPASDPHNVNGTNLDPLKVRFTDLNSTMLNDEMKAHNAVQHRVWDFSDWLRTRIQGAINQTWQNALSGAPSEVINFLGGPPVVVKSTGRVELWKTSGTTPDNILLMAGVVIDLLVNWDLVRHYSGDFSLGNVSFQGRLDIDFHVSIGMTFALSVTSDFGDQKTDYFEINTFEVYVPENATFTWRKIGVIVYYGSGPTGIGVTGGVSRGNASVSGSTGTLFFVDYGWDGTPDFATNGTTKLQVDDSHATCTDKGFPFTVHLTKSGTGWIYFNVTLPSGTSKSNLIVTRSDGKTVNSTQYWIDPSSHKLYVCDDPAYTYTVGLSGAGAGTSFTTMMIIGAAIALVVIAAAVVVLRRRGAKPTNVSIK